MGHTAKGNAAKLRRRESAEAREQARALLTPEEVEEQQAQRKAIYDVNR